MPNTAYTSAAGDVVIGQEVPSLKVSHVRPGLKSGPARTNTRPATIFYSLSIVYFFSVTLWAMASVRILGCMHFRPSQVSLGRAGPDFRPDHQEVVYSIDNLGK